jgi:ABC-type polysaccharide/polyol phosphate export permease
MSGGVRRWVQDLVRRRDLLYMLAWREIKVKYKQSVMGFLWAIFMPIVIILAGLMVRHAAASLAGRSIRFEDFLLVSAKAVPWAFFVTAIRFGSNSLVSNANLVTKIYMPREIFPIAAICSAFVDFAIAASVLAIVMAIVGIPLHAGLLLLPAFIAMLVMLSMALAVFLSAAGLFFRDVKYIVEVILTFAIFFTPVLYEVTMFDRWAALLMLNPVAPVLEGIGAVVANRPLPDPAWFAYSGGVAVAGLAAALVFFKRLEPYFAESV